MIHLFFRRKADLFGLPFLIFNLKFNDSLQNIGTSFDFTLVSLPAINNFKSFKNKLAMRNWIFCAFLLVGISAKATSIIIYVSPEKIVARADSKVAATIDGINFEFYEVPKFYDTEIGFFVPQGKQLMKFQDETFSRLYGSFIFL